LLLFHVGSFRTRFFYGMGKVGRGLQTVFIHGPVWIVHLPALQAILHNRFWVVIRRCVFWPVLMAAAGGLIMWWCGQEVPAIAGTAAACMALGIILLNTYLGRDLEEAATDWLLRLWVWLTIDFVPGLLRWIMDLFRYLLEAIEQLLYTVN